MTSKSYSSITLENWTGEIKRLKTMKIYTVSFAWKSWSGKATSHSDAIRQGALALGVDLNARGISMSIRW